MKVGTVDVMRVMEERPETMDIRLEWANQAGNTYLEISQVQDQAQAEALKNGFGFLLVREHQIPYEPCLAIRAFAPTSTSRISPWPVGRLCVHVRDQNPEKSPLLPAR